MVFSNYVPIYKMEDGKKVVLSVLYVDVPEETDLARKAKFSVFDAKGIRLTRGLDFDKRDVLRNSCLLRQIVEEEINHLFPDLSKKQVDDYADKLFGGLEIK